MKFRLIPSILITILLCIVTSKIVYFGFTPKYGPLIYSKKSFHGMFDHDVFKYRILSQHILFALDDWIESHLPPRKTEKFILARAEPGSEGFYYAFYYLNTFFLCLTSIVLILLLRLKQVFILTDIERHLLLFLTILVINFSQFVVGPYDISSYFFQVLILYIFLIFIDKDYTITLIALSALIFLSALNKETAALSVSIIALLLFQKYGLIKRSIISIGALSITFLTTYLALRYVIIDPENRRFSYKNAGNLLVSTNIIGLLFWAFFFYCSIVLANSLENRWMILVYHLLSLPYIIVCLKDGVLWEVRLYIPLFLGSLFLARMDTSTFKIHISTLTKLLVERRKGRISSKSITT